MDFSGWFVAGGTLILAIVTWRLVIETRKSAEQVIVETRESTARQIGVQTWLALEARLDAKEMKRARRKLAQQLASSVALNSPDIGDEVFDLFEAIGSVYNEGLLHKELAVSSFSYYSNRWWAAARAHIAEMRRQKSDASLYAHWEKLGVAMHNHDPRIGDAEIKEFLAEEIALHMD